MNILKLIISFISGIFVCCLILFGVKTVLPIKAETDGSISENVSASLVNFLPDIEKIYRDALTSPFIKAESKIYDPDIAEYYHDLVGRSVLGEQGTEP